MPNMKKSTEGTLMWLYTILIVPAIIMVIFWLNGYLRFN
jgi:hypothetical protein